jgi:autotransporter-associated beta strand protein
VVQFNVAGSSRRINAAGWVALLLAGTCLSPVAEAQQTIAGTVTFRGRQTADTQIYTVTSTGSINFTVFSSAGAGTYNVNSGGRVSFTDQATASSATFNISNGGSLVFDGFSPNAGTGTITNAGVVTLGSVNASQANYIGSGANASIQVARGQEGTETTLGSLAGTGTVNLNTMPLTIGGNNASTTFSGTFVGGTNVTKVGSGTLVLTGDSSQTFGGQWNINGGLIGFSSANSLGYNLIQLNGGGLQWQPGTTDDISSQAYGLGIGANGGVLDTNGNNVTFNTPIGFGPVTKAGAGTLSFRPLGGSDNWFSSLTVTGGLVNFVSASNLGSGSVTLNGGGLQWAPGNTADISARLAPLGPGGGTFDTNGNNVTLAGAITGSGGLTKSGSGTLTLLGANTYTGGTVVSAGTLSGNSTSLQGNIVNNAAVVFAQGTNGSGTYAGNMSGSGNLTVTGGTLTTTGNISISGSTTVLGGKLVVNGTLTGTVFVLAGGVGGSGTIGHAVFEGGWFAPGNSIGTLNIGGNLVKQRGHFHAELNAAGQSDRIQVGGTATISGGTVVVMADPGIYANSTTYTILSAAGGVTGGYGGVVGDLAFLTPTLTSDANNLYLTLALQGAAFSGFSGNTANQRAVGYALDQSYASASGDYATVIGALAGLSTAQGPAALSAISSQPWANFGTTNLASSTLFMNTLGQQMAMARGSVVASGGQRQALAQACDVAACDGASPFTVWGSALGGTGSALGDGNTATLTYTLGGAAAGIDYRVTPNVLVGVGAGYTSGTQWADGFMGKGWNNAVSVAAYGSFTQSGFYADLLAGYAYANNQLQRQIMVPNLQPRTANGSAGANQFLGQVEFGYQIPVYAPASAIVTPFGRFQVMSVNQAAFSEWGANSLSLNVAQQTTNSVRSTIGMDLGGVIGSFDLRLRLGWLHEYADVSRPITAAFAGAPGAAFTVYGATGQRDAAVIGFQAGTTVADGAKIYVRYDGDIATSASNHALTAGLRLAF